MKMLDEDGTDSVGTATAETQQKRQAASSQAKSAAPNAAGSS